MSVSNFGNFRCRARVLGVLVLLAGELPVYADSVSSSGGSEYAQANSTGIGPGLTWVSDASVDLTVSEQFLSVSYDASSPDAFDILVTSEIELSAEISRLKFWYAPVLGETDITFLVRDGDGVIHELDLVHVSQIDPALTFYDSDYQFDWALWTKAESVSIRMPEESEIESRLSAEDVSAAKSLLWAQPYRFVGLRLEKGAAHWGSTSEDKAAIREGEGTVVIKIPEEELVTSFEASNYGMIQELKRWARDEPMLLFPDDLVLPYGDESFEGTLRYRVKVKEGYQGALLWKAEGIAVVDQSDAVSLMESAIELPYLPIGHYTILTEAYDEDDQFLKSRLYQWYIAEGPTELPAEIVEGLRMETGQDDNVYPPDTSEVAMVVAEDDAEGSVAYQVEISDFRGSIIYSQILPIDGALTVNLEVTPGRDYFCTAKSLYDEVGSRVKETTLLHFGVENEVKVAGVTPDMPNLDELLEGRNEPHVEYWIRTHASQRYPWFSTVDLEDMKGWSDQVKEFGWDILAVRTLWPDLELLPGVTRWEEMDEIIDYLADNGQRVMLGASIWGERWETVWGNTTPMRDQYGDFGESTGSAGAWDPVSLAGKSGFLKNLASRYNDKPTVVGYHILGASLSADSSPEEVRNDYSDATQSAFNDWLRERGEVPYVMPALLSIPGSSAHDLGPDLSSRWTDLTEFFTYTNASTIKSHMAAIRAVDSERPILVDRKPFPWGVDALVPLLVEDGNASLKNEGTPRTADLALKTIAVQAGVPYLGELHRHVPTSRSLADVCYFWESLWADYALWIQRWRQYQWEEQWESGTDSLREDVPEVEAYMMDTQANWNRFTELPYEVPEVLVLGSNAAAHLGARRRGFYEEVEGISEFVALYRQHQLPVYMATEDSDWVDLGDFKLVFAVGDVMTQEVMDRIVDYALAGGRLVLVGNAGKYTVRNSDQLNYLSGLLAGKSNVRQISDLVRDDLPEVTASDRPFVFDRTEVDSILAWAGVARTAEVETDAAPGFELAVRRSRDQSKLHVGVMRSWYGGYQNRIEKEDDLQALYGFADGTVKVRGLEDGLWSVTKFHREAADFGQVEARDGELKWELDLAEAAEVQLFELNLLARSGSFADVVGATVYAQDRWLFESDVFGFFWQEPGWSNWIYLAGMGWLYTGQVSDSGGMWLWSQALGTWFYTSRSLFGWCYVFQSEGGSAEWVRTDANAWLQFFTYGDELAGWFYHSRGGYWVPVN